MATSLTSPGLIKAANEALVKAQGELNMARLFAYDFSGEFSDFNSTVKVPIVNAGVATDFNMDSNDYETIGGAITYASIKLDAQPKVTFGFSGNDVLEAPNAPYWNKCAEGGAQSIRAYISKKLGGLLTSEKCTGGEVTLDTVTKAKLAGLRSKCKARVADTVLGLDPATYEATLALFDANVYGGRDAIQDGKFVSLYGFKAVIQLNDLPATIKGALIPADSIAWASRGVAVADESCYSEIGNAADEYGFTLTVMRHGSAGKGTGFINLTTLVGADVVQGDQIVLIK